MGKLPTIYRKSPDVVASVPYSDLASVTGYERYYLSVGTQISGAAVISGQVLTPQTVYSQTIASSIVVSNAGTAWTKAYDQNFDLNFNVGRSIKGNAIVNIDQYMFGTTNTTQSGQFLIFLYKVDTSGNQTLVSSGQTIMRTASANSGSENVEQVILPILSKTSIKAGEKLRLNVQDYVFSGAGPSGSYTWYIPHDPSDRTSLTIGGSDIFTTSATNILLPFTIDL